MAYPFATGEVLTAATINAVSLSLIGSDATGGNTTSATYAQVGSTINVPASTVSDHVLIVVELKAELHNNGNQTGSYATYVDIRIDDVSKKAIEPFCSMSGAYSGAEDDTFTRTIMFFYAPTAGQKSSGFTVKIMGKVAATGTNNTATMYAQDILVFGG
jgi:hypothetical protein